MEITWISRKASFGEVISILSEAGQYMKWYSDLYLGDSVKHPRRLRWKIEHNAKTMVYVIALSTAGGCLLDIIPSWVLLQKGYPWRKNLKIIGLARGYHEALEVVQKIVEDTYRNTGAIDIQSWLRESRRNVR